MKRPLFAGPSSSSSSLCPSSTLNPLLILPPHFPVLSDPSSELYTDLCGVDSEQFLTETLKTNAKSRSFLISIEKDVLSFIRDESRTSHRFPGMNTFNRMLVHRVAAFFGLDHSVEKRTPDCVTITKCEKTRIPDMKFEDIVPIPPEALTHAPDNHCAEPKQVLKRSDGKGASFEKSPDRRNNSGRNDSMKKSGSYEERQVRYQHVRERIFASQGSSGSDGGGDGSSGISSNIEMTANSSLKSSQDTVCSKTWSSFESGTGSTSRRLKRQNRVMGSLDSENMTSNHFLTPDYHSMSQENSTGKKLGVVPKASSFGGATECSEKSIDLKVNDSRLPRTNSFNTTTSSGSSTMTGGTDISSGDSIRNKRPDDSNEKQAKCNDNSDSEAAAATAAGVRNQRNNGSVCPSDTNAQSGIPSPTSETVPSPSDSCGPGSSVGILPKPLVHQSSAPESGGGRANSSMHQQHQQYQNQRQNSWQTSYHQSFNYQQNQHQQNTRWHHRDPQQNHHHYQSGHYSGPRHRYPRGMNYNSSATTSAHAPGHQHFVTGPTLPPPGAFAAVNPAAAGFWTPHPDLRPNTIIMSESLISMPYFLF